MSETKKKVESMTLHEKLAIIQSEFKSKKSRWNAFGKYHFRSAEDILEDTKLFIEELRVTFKIEETIIDSPFGFPMLESKASITDGIDIIYATAIVGIDLDQKGMQMPQKFGSASSYGKKYALGNLLLIDDTQDSDATNNHKPSTAAAKKPKLEGDAIQKAKDFLKGKGTIEQVLAKYEVSTAVLKELL
jgi:hypothetical protein